MEEKTQRQGGLDREVRVLPLRASRARSVRFPGGDGRRGQPDGDVASTDQRAIIGGPVLDVVLCLVRGMDSRLHPSSLVCPLATSLRIRAPTPRRRWRTRRDVSGRSSHCGLKADRISALVMTSTRLAPNAANIGVSEDNHCFRCFSFLNVRERAAWTSVAAASRVGTVRRSCRRSVRGSPPARATFRNRRACSRASASVTSVTLPRPRSQRFPLMTVRSTQLLEPLGATTR